MNVQNLQNMCDFFFNVLWIFVLFEYNILILQLEEFGQKVLKSSVSTEPVYIWVQYIECNINDDH